ncbi:hypothetical protein GCM10022396_23340 [Flavivirga amylovorans]
MTLPISMNTKENTSEEIDLGQLFKLIGNAINTFFNRIAFILKTIFHLFIVTLLFFKGHFLKFSLATFLGVGVGGYIDYTASPLYKSVMIIQSNFNSTRQLYSNIDFYNQLVKNQETKELSEVLHISQSIAKSIKNIEITGVSDEIQKLKQFGEFIKNLDSVTLKNVDYQDYLQEFNDINAEFHQEVQIEATAPETAKQCQKGIVTSIENNEYFKLQKKVNEDNIMVIDSMIKKQQREINKLQSFYKEIRLLEAQQPVGATNINLTDNKIERISEIELFNQIKKLKEEEVKLNIEKAKTKSTVNIISEFPERGILKNDFFSKKIIQMPLFFISGLFLILIMYVFNKYLANYTK